MSGAWRCLALLVATSIALVATIANPARAAEPTKAVVWSDLGFRLDESIWIGNPDGSAARKLADGWQADLSPDGRWVAYTHFTEKEGFVSDELALEVIPTSGGPARVVYTRPFDGESHFDYIFGWSSDSSALAFGVNGDDPLLATYDVNSGSRVMSTSLLNPLDLEFVPNSGQIFVVASGTNRHFLPQISRSILVLVNSADGRVRQVGELTRRFPSSLIASPTAVVFEAGPDPHNDDTASVRTKDLRIFDLVAGNVRRIGDRSVYPIGWRSDARTLDVATTSCTKGGCRMNAGVLDAGTGSIVPGVSLGQTKISSRKVRRRKARRGKRTRIVKTVSADLLLPMANATDGRSLLAWQLRYTETGANPNPILRAEKPFYRIVRVPLDGAPPVPIARGVSADWNL